MDFTSIIGMVAAFGLMIYGMVNGHDFSVIVDNFVDIPSVYCIWWCFGLCVCRKFFKGIFIWFKVH